MVSPQTILNRGFAIVSYNKTIITDPALIPIDAEIETQLGDMHITSKVIKKENNDEK